MTAPSHYRTERLDGRSWIERDQRDAFMSRIVDDALELDDASIEHSIKDKIHRLYVVCSICGDHALAIRDRLVLWPALPDLQALFSVELLDLFVIDDPASLAQF